MAFATMEQALAFAGKPGPSTRIRRTGPARGAMLLGIAVLFIYSAPLMAGPPFFTDDPEPIGFRHWEFYVASAQTKDDLGRSGTLPHFEINFGFAPDMMVHVIAGASFAKPSGRGFRWGLADTEVGLKFRFVHETESRPQIGTFPHLELPTGNSRGGLGSGEFQALLPIWVQKSWGPWTTYGGGGYWINPGPGNKNYWWFGWEVQRSLSKAVTLGAEVFANTPSAAGATGASGFNLGAIVSITRHHSALLSIGRDIHGADAFFLYIALYSTFGPAE